MQPRIGVSSIGVDASSWADRCQTLEAIGVDEISVSDHLVPSALPPMVALAAAAAATERVTLSTMVLNNELRHPGVLANEAAALAEISGGRFTLGIGAGHGEAEHRAIGLPFPERDRRIKRLGESVRALRVLLAGEELTTEGPEFRFTGHRVAPVPTAPVSILVGGGAPAVLEIAARDADVVGLTGFSAAAEGTRLTHFTAAALADRLDLVRGLAGDRPLRFQALVQQVCLTDDRERRAAELVTEWDEPALDVEAALDSPFLLIGTPDEIATQLCERTARYDIETWTTFSGRPIDVPLDGLAEVITALRD